MEYLIIIIAVLAGALASLIFWSMYQAEKTKTDSVRGLLSEATKELEETRAFSGDQKSRLEAVIAGLKREVASLEKDLRACTSDPGTIRDRLRQLLGSAEAPVPGPNSGGGVGVPPGTAPHP